jgi:hypothetical protein
MGGRFVHSIGRRNSEVAMDKFGPHDVVSSGEIQGTLAVLALAAVAYIWMAYGTRQRATTPTPTTTANTTSTVATTRPKAM